LLVIPENTIAVHGPMNVKYILPCFIPNQLTAAHKGHCYAFAKCWMLLWQRWFISASYCSTWRTLGTGLWAQTEVLVNTLHHPGSPCLKKFCQESSSQN